MKALSADPEETELATKFTVRDYKAARHSEQKDKIADAISLRFTERYIKPANDPTCKHGFTMMAISCLMIEALESFRRGRIKTNSGKAAFCDFFNATDSFKELRPHCEQFYRHIRCGILHQAETTGGWRITRDESAVPFFDSVSYTINAQRFLDNLSEALKDFCDTLKAADWNSEQWKNVVQKTGRTLQELPPIGTIAKHNLLYVRLSGAPITVA